MKVVLVYPDIASGDWHGYFYHGIAYISSALKKAGHDVSFLHVTCTPSREEYIAAFNYLLDGEDRFIVGYSSTTNMFS